MNDDLKTRIKELKEELELLEKATDAKDKTLFTITAKIASHSDKGKSYCNRCRLQRRTDGFTLLPSRYESF